MPRQYLDVPYRAKDAAKALGARFDGTVKRWYVEEETDLVAFAAWLPAGVAGKANASAAVAMPSANRADPVSVRKGIPLSRLLNGVAAAVAQAFAGGVWTLVEVNEATVRNGHVYLELSERDSAGQPVARAKAMIWASTAGRILPEFERATGAVIGAGIKLLVRAKPVFKAQYGFSLEIDAIDPDYTLGDLEARKKEIRERLQQEGVFDRNRRLAPPWDYGLVLVVAPQDAAGLGDFQKEADRLARFGVCRFVYAHSRFQGEGAGRMIVAAATAALREMAQEGGPVGSAGPLHAVRPLQPDAIVIIRGGGAVNDLAWLNDYDLARFICDQGVPVLTGIGHERDSTLPDEVAHARFDTPSKVIAGIEQQILGRSREARQAWEAIIGGGVQATRTARLAAERTQAQVRADSLAHVSRGRQDIRALLSDVEGGAVRQVHEVSRKSLGVFTEVSVETRAQVAAARQRVPALMASVRVDALGYVGEKRAVTCVAYNTVIDRSAAASRSARQAVDSGLQRVVEHADGTVHRARTQAQALLREVAGQGPEKTLGRGFAIVRNGDGLPVTSSQEAQESLRLSIQFRDGSTQVTTDTSQQ